jgi:phosphatidylserine decarboxylase
VEHSPRRGAPRTRSAPSRLKGPHWRLASAGRPMIVLLGAIGLAAGLLFPWAVPLVLLAAGAIAFTFRDPARAIERRPEVALAPADGRVIHIGRVWDPHWQIELVEIAIFLAIWDVHVQRSPLDGEVVARHRRAGGYRPAISRAATHGNNQLATYLRTAAGPCVVTQISGLIARRIVSWAAPGTRLLQGDRLGMIQFGSQTTVRLPTTATLLVHAGARVQAGVTPVARLDIAASLPAASCTEMGAVASCTEARGSAMDGMGPSPVGHHEPGPARVEWTKANCSTSGTAPGHTLLADPAPDTPSGLSLAAPDLATERPPCAFS